MEYNGNFGALDVHVAHYFGGGSYAKETLIPAGIQLKQHKHSFDHLSILASGAVVVDVEGERVKYDAPACIVIAAGKEHAVTALTPVVWYCVHATDCTDAAQIDHELTHEKD